jgi:hypothetical protein
VIGAFAAGRIINPRMVESQLCGGMIWGDLRCTSRPSLIRGPAV